MMDPLFEQYCRDSKVTPIDPDTLRDDSEVLKIGAAVMKTWVERIRERFPKIPSFCAGYIEARGFGAAADILNETAAVRIHGATPIIIANLVAAVLSHPNSLEVHGRQILVNPQGMRLDKGRLEERLFNEGRPISAEPLSFIAVAICNFIFFHEFIHIRNGHVDLFKSAVGLLAMEETKSELSERLTFLDRQAMEWDADKIAHWLSTDIALSTMLQRPFNTFSTERVRETFWVYHVFLYILFKLMDALEHRNLEQRVHPTPTVRMSFLLIQMKQLSEMLRIGPLSDDFVTEVIRTGEVAWALVTGSASADILGHLASMEAQLDDGVAVLRQWNSLRKRLEPFNRGPTELSRPNLD